MQNSNANLSYEKFSNGREEWYDANGKLLHAKDPDGYEWWHEYDANGKLIHEKSSTGYEWWDEANGKLVHVKCTDGSEVWFDYDDTGHIIHEKHSDGSEKWYDANGNYFMQKMLTDQKLGLIPMGMRFLWKMHQ